jgi:hypothetical protein
MTITDMHTDPLDVPDNEPVPPLEPEPALWSLDDVTQFMGNVRHSFHLTADPTMVVTHEGKRAIGGMRASCICGLKVGGLTDVKMIFELIKEHCEPL